MQDIVTLVPGPTPYNWLGTVISGATNAKEKWKEIRYIWALKDYDMNWRDISYDVTWYFKGCRMIVLNSMHFMWYILQELYLISNHHQWNELLTIHCNVQKKDFMLLYKMLILPQKYLQRWKDSFSLLFKNNQIDKINDLFYVWVNHTTVAAAEMMLRACWNWAFLTLCYSFLSE